MLTLRFFVYCLFYVALCSVTLAEGSKWTLSRSDAAQLALSRNYELRAARYAVERARATSLDAGVLPNPELGLSGASDFAFNNEGEYAWSVSLSQQFPVTGRLRLLRSLAKQEVALAATEVNKAELELLRDISEVFDQIEANLLEAALFEHQFALSTSFQAFLKTKANQGEASPFDLRQAELASVAAKQRLTRLELRQKRLYDQLRQLCGLNAEAVLTITPGTEILPQLLPAVEPGLLQRHPAYALKEQLAAIALNERYLARAQRWSDITVEVFYEQGFNIDEPIGFERERFLGLAVSIPLPLHDRNRGAIQSSRIRERQIAAEMEGTVFALRSAAESLRRRYSEIQEHIRSYEAELIELAEVNVRELEAAYVQGEVELTAVFRAREQLLELRIELLELQAERTRLWTQWRFTTAQL